MRKIEEKMLNAIANGRDMNCDNTIVCHFDDGAVRVYLHGNSIATIANGLATVNAITLQDFPTKTTRSRLRALGFSVKKGICANPVIKFPN